MVERDGAEPDEAERDGAERHGVELRNVSFRAGGALILDDVSVRFEPGKLNVVLGPNGAGKSTLLRIATGLARPTSGDVRYDGRSIAELALEPLARRRAVLSQHVELAFPLGVADVVMMGRYPHYGRVPTERDVEIVGSALALVGMEAKHDQPYPTLSGGERQKVHLARVLAQIWRDDSDAADTAAAQRYLFLDEPTSGLDVHYQLHILNVVRALLSPGYTVVAVLHDLNMAFEHGDHFVLLEHGRVAVTADDARGIPAEVLERVFRVRARRMQTASTTSDLWRFEL
jgi:iron complex transport system ATP-binding protein